MDLKNSFNNTKKLKFLDVFSGIGGFKIALENVGFEGIGFCDNDKYAVQLYLAYHSKDNEVYYDDVRTIDTNQLPDFDILCAGFPCQSFSIAGKRRGFDDTRGTLFFEVARILSDKKPKYFILENVKGLLNHDSGRTFRTIIKVLTDLGYSVQWQVLNSKFFGVPQNRERVYIVGCLGTECIGKIFPLTGIAEENISEIRKHPLSTKTSQGDRVYETDGLSTCLTSNGGGLGGKTGLYFINKPRFDKYKASNIVETLKVGGDTPLMRIKNGTKKGYDEATIGDGINLAFPNSKTRRGRVGKRVSQTLDTHCNMGTIDDDFRIRRLTPTECFRLQGFPDAMVQQARELGISDSQLYKMAGNAVTVNVAQAVAQKIWEVEYGT
jgi:DNA (cytosine-5)-methyltransferase 1